MTDCKKQDKHPFVICIDSFEKNVSWLPMDLSEEKPTDFLKCKYLEMYTLQKQPCWRMFLDENAGIEEGDKRFFAVDGLVFLNRAIIAQWSHKTGDWEDIETTAEKLYSRINWCEEEQEKLYYQRYKRQPQV